MRIISLSVVFILFLVKISYSQFNFDKQILDQNTVYNNETGFGDFDNNGDMDIIVTHYALGEVDIYFKMNGQFIKKNILKGLTQPGNLLVSDFNKDGNLDFVIAFKPSANIFTFLNDGTGQNFKEVLGATSGGSIPVESEMFDLNNDGYQDLVVGFSPVGVRMFINKKDGTFTNQNISSAIKRPGGICVADIDKDNKIDIVATSFTSTELYVFWGNGGTIPTFSTEIIDKDLSAPNGCAVSDINNDGKNDILVSNFSGNKLLFYTFDGALFTKREVSSISNPTSIFVHDLNKDGHKDIICYEQGKSTIRAFTSKNNGSSFENYILDSANEPNGWLTFVDWDKDNDLDIIVPCKSKMMFFENNTILSSIADTENSLVKIFPNPSTDFLNIQCDGFISCQIFNFEGTLVCQSDSEYLNVSSLKPGVHFVVVNTLYGEFTNKFLKY